MKKALVVYCGVGGCCVGFHRAGYEVTGVDIAPQPDYPFTFIQNDALEVLADRDFCEGFDLISTSPPCQSQSTITKGTNKGKVYPRLLPQTRFFLHRIDRPSVIENVPAAAMRRDLMLCGTMFGLKVLRHRFFEIRNAKVAQLPHQKHLDHVSGWRHGQVHEGEYLGVYGKGGYKGTVEEWQAAMGIDWTSNRKSIAEAVPPSYTEYIGQQIGQAA